MNDIPIKLCECGCGERVALAPKTNARYGWIKGEPLRFIHGHNGRKSASEYLIDPETGCWIWQRAIAYSRQGYGVSYDGRKPKDAHRVVYERHRGPIPAGMHLHHTCGNPPCVNPDHLEPLLPRDHARLDARARKSPLTIEDVREIRASSELGYVLARHYGVTPATISNIRRHRTWRE